MDYFIDANYRDNLHSLLLQTTKDSGYFFSGNYVLDHVETRAICAYMGPKSENNSRTKG